MSKKLPNILLHLWIMVGYSLLLPAQNQLFWHQIKPPLLNDFEQISITGTDSILVCGKRLLVFHQQQWQAFKPQPPCHIHKMFAVSPNRIYVCNSTPYQNSELFLWNGKKWQKIYNPIANAINDMFFTDEKNAYLVSYGEIVRLHNGNWEHLPPPDNENIIQVLPFNNQVYIVVSNKGVYVLKNSKWQLIPHTINVKKIKILDGQLYVTGRNLFGIITENQLITLSNLAVWSQINNLTVYDNKIFAAGNKGLVLIWENQKSTRLNMATKQNLNAILVKDNHIWIVGNNATIIKSDFKNTSSEKYAWKGFKQVTFRQNAKVIDDEYAVIAADFNNDGKMDIFTAGLFEQEHLYINTGNMKFYNQAEQWGLTLPVENGVRPLNLGACASDLDNDGDIDLYISILNGKNRIFFNINNKYFVDYSKISQATGLTTDRTNACIMGDVDNDGDLDIFIANEFSTNRLYLNNGVGIFTEVTQKAGLLSQKGGNSATFSDFDRDGDIDLMITNWSATNTLYKNLLKETGKLQFEDITKQAGIGGNAYDKSNAVIFTDINNDAYPDLFTSNRKTSNQLYINNQNGTFTDKTKVLTGLDSLESYGAVITDFDGDGLKDIYVSNVGNNSFYKNMNGKFIELSRKYDIDIPGYSTGSAYADFDNDGDPDIYLANYLGASSCILQNNADTGTFYRIKFSLAQNNRNGIGSKIFVYNAKNQLTFYEEVSAGSGYVSMNTLSPIVPVTSLPAQLKIIFPNGQSLTKTITRNTPKIFYISDTSKSYARYLNLINHFKKNFKDPHLLLGNLGFLLVLIILLFSSYRGIKKFRWSILTALFFAVLIALFYIINYQYFEYRNPFFAIAMSFSGVILLVFLLHYYFERHLIKKEALEKQKQIKLKISRNLHDDLGATLSSVNLYNGLIKQQLNKDVNQVNKLLQQSENLLKKATDTITDLIWGIRPQAETLENILFKTQNNLKDLLDAQDIRLKIIWQNPDLKLLKLKDQFKQNTYLILKEALNNTFKYAGAGQIEIKISQQKKQLIFLIKDNGKGFDYQENKYAGYGLENMKHRALELPNGQFSIQSGMNGTSIRFGFQIK